MKRGNRMSSGLIIVVDDNPSFRKLYSDFLSVHGYTVMTAKTGAEGMQLLLNCTPKVLILDISMPGLDGIETCKQIRRLHGHDMPVLFLSSFNDIDKLRDCLRAGGDDYLIKSDKLDSILERVKFWSAAPNRQAVRQRRTEVMREVDTTIDRIDREASESSGVDREIDKMSRLIVTAQTLAEEANLTGQDYKLYVFGYAAGIVSNCADSQLSVKAHYLDYLRAALWGSYLLKREDIKEALENFNRLSAEPLFMMARKRAHADCRENGEMQGDVTAKQAAAGPP